MNLIAFDIETEMIPDEWDRLSPLKIFCGSAYCMVEGELGSVHGAQAWYAGQSNEDNPPLAGVEELAAGIESGRVVVAGQMSPSEVEAMFDQLLELVSGKAFLIEGVKLKGSGPFLLTWNGVGFDFPVIAGHLPHRRQEIVDLCLGSIDPCFQFTQRLGYPIGLKNIAESMLPDGRVMEMTGQDAALWPLDAGNIIRYNANDPLLALDVIEVIKAEKQVRWTSRAGKPSAKTAREFKIGSGWGLVRGAIKLGDYDRSRWKDYDGAFDLERTIGWME